MPRPTNPMSTTVQILDEIKKHPEGVSTATLTKALGRPVSSPISKLFAYDVIGRRKDPASTDRKQFLYFTKLPKVKAPPAATADVSTPHPAMAET